MHAPFFCVNSLEIDLFNLRVLHNPCFAVYRIVGLPQLSFILSQRDGDHARISAGDGAVRRSSPIRHALLKRYMGKVTIKELPCPGVLSTLIFPPWASTTHLAIASPSPVPPSSRDLALSTR